VLLKGFHFIIFEVIKRKEKVVKSSKVQDQLLYDEIVNISET